MKMDMKYGIFFKSGMCITVFVLAMTFSCSREKKEVPETKIEKTAPVQKAGGPENLPPEIRDIEIAPREPVTGENVKLSFKCVDPEARHCESNIIWVLNNEPVEDVRGFVFPGARLHKGDVLHAEITAKDDKGAQVSVSTPDVYVLNAPPEIVRYVITPPNPSADDSIRIELKFEDPDGDPVSAEFVWYVDGEVVDDVEGNVLPPGHARAGQSVEVDVTPFDGESRGETVHIGPIEISNRPPRFVSPPPTNLQVFGTLQWQFKAVDPDGDPVSFYLEGNVPPGMRIDSSSGVLSWQVDNEVLKKGLSFVVVARDSHGAETKMPVRLGPAKVK